MTDATVLTCGLEPSAALAARTLVAQALSALGSDIVDDAQLVVTELLTNAQLHGSPPILVRATPYDGYARIEVEDFGRQLLVMPRHSTDAMTGRGLSLVAAVAPRWGVEPGSSGGKTVWAEVSGGLVAQPSAPDVDVESLLAAWASEEPAETEYTVRLGAVPTELLLEAKRHIDNVVREFTLHRAAATSAEPLPPQVAALVETVTRDFSRARSDIKRQAAEAASAGLPLTELELTLPASSVAAGERYLSALDEADRYALEARLLTLATPPLHRVFRRWYVQALIDQLRARAAGVQPEDPPTFVQVLSGEVRRLSESGATPVQGRRSRTAAHQFGRVDYEALFGGIPTSYLVMDPRAPDYIILDANDLYLANVGRALDEIVGQPVFEAFPPSADTLDDDGVPWIRRSFDRAVETRRPDTMPLQKYDVPSADGEQMVERYWSLISVPIVDDSGEVALLVQRAENITDFVLDRQDVAPNVDSEVWRRRVVEVEGDLYLRARELAAALRAKDIAGRRLAALAEVTLHLGSADTVDDLVETVFRDGLPVMNGSGGSIGVRDETAHDLVLTITPSLGNETTTTYAQIPLHGTLPSSRVASHGTPIFIRNASEAEAFEGLPVALAMSSTRALAVLPLVAGNRLLGSFAVTFADDQTFPPEEVELLAAFAASCAQALDRLATRDKERQSAAEVQRIAETLQRSLLTSPPASPDMQFAVLYQPAQQVAQVGGDWYDAFTIGTDCTTIVIGDVAGHDQDAAAAMAQVRNVLRGVAQAVRQSPALVLRSLDNALDDLDIDVLATVVLAQLQREASTDSWRMTWANAGHPPPVLLRADGTAELLERHTQDVLVGWASGGDRADHEVVLSHGDTVLLYTDGLVETRGGDIEDDLERLRRAVERHDPSRGPDALLRSLVDGLQTFDDIALLAVQLH